MTAPELDSEAVRPLPHEPRPVFRVADTGVIKGLWVRCRGTYHAFDKYNAALALFIEERHLPRPKK